jgi:hypothetical protein
MEMLEIVNVPLSLSYSNLHPGPQTLMVFNVVSPAEIYVCNIDQVEHFSNTIVPAVEQAADKAKFTKNLTEGSGVLVCEDECWYRATVNQMVGHDRVSVFLFDIGRTIELPRGEVKEAPMKIFKYPVVAVKAALEGYEEMDEKVAKEKWGEEMAEAVEQFEELEVVVTEKPGSGKCVMRVPKLERKKTKIQWRKDEEIVQIKHFEVDTTERVNVHKLLKKNRNWALELWTPNAN